MKPSYAAIDVMCVTMRSHMGSILNWSLITVALVARHHILTVPVRLLVGSCAMHP